MKRVSGLILVLCVILTACQSKQDNAKSEHEEGAKMVEISPASQQEAGIKTGVLAWQRLPKVVSAPGEVVPNANLSSIATTKVPAQIIKRFVQVGQVVSEGQPLALLSSVEMAKAQGEALMTAQDWTRMQYLGKEAVSAKRYTEADVAAQQARAKLMAYGMTPSQVDAFLKANDSQKATGEFEIVAAKKGILFAANGVEGEMVEPGSVLFNIVNSASLWVDAKLSPRNAQLVSPGAKAWITLDQKKFLGKVLQIHPQLDEVTRTQTVRIEIPQPNSYLRPGQFVECDMVIGQTAPVLAVPSDAVLQSSDNDWVVYLEQKPNYFVQQEIKVAESIEGESIIEGIKPGVTVVMQGAFFVHSEFSKGTVDPHGH